MNIPGLKDKGGHAILILLTGVIVVVYTFFFTSKLYMDSSANLHYTRLNSVVTMEQNRTVQIVNWTYSESQHTMEVILSINNTKSDGIDQYTFSALAFPSSSISAKVIIADPTMYVVHITGVAPSFKEISLHMAVDSDTDKSVAKLYTNTLKVSRIKQITEKTKKQYFIVLISGTISSYQQSIQTLKDQNDQINALITKIKQTNITLQEDEAYQTPDQIAITNTTIDSNAQQIETYQQQIDANNVNIQSIQTQIDSANEKLYQIK